MEQFDQLLTCPICLDRYKNPKLLPCQHSFCMEPCLEGLIDYVRRQIKCPECRAEHRIPYQGISQFPNNVTLQRFLELHADITGELPDPTAGQTMERCGVCSERNFVSPCAHCEKKVCADCKEGHMQALRREIHRFSNQVKRSLHRLSDMSEVIEKNSGHLQTNCARILEEIEDMSKRLQKTIRDKEASLKQEVETYLSSEVRSLADVKENLDMEVSNIKGNCDLVESHLNEDVEWEDCELVETKDIFVKTVEFVRNFDHEAGCNERDFTRRVRLIMNQDVNSLNLGLSHIADINIHNPQASTVSGLQNSASSLNLALSRSKSDHRLAVHFRDNERFASDNDMPARRTSVAPGDDDHSPSSRRNRYKSRFHRATTHTYDQDSDSESHVGGRGVRFDSNRPESPPVHREKVLDTDDAIKGPLSGITRLADAPRILLKLSETEKKKEKKEKLPPPPLQTVPVPTVPQEPPPRPQPPPRTQRQVSEEDEITKQKRMNKEWAASQPGGANAQTDTTPTPMPTAPSRDTSGAGNGRTTPASRPGSRQSTNRDDSTPTTPTSRKDSAPATPTSRKESTPATPTGRKESTPATPTGRKESTPATPTGRKERPNLSRADSDQAAPWRPASRQESTEDAAPWRVSSTIRKRGTAGITEERPSSRATVDDDTESESSTASRPKTGTTTAPPVERKQSSTPSTVSSRVRRTSSDSSTSSGGSSRSSSPPKTGAAFSASQVRQRYEAPSTGAPTAKISDSASETARSRVRASEPPAPGITTPASGSRFLDQRTDVARSTESTSSDSEDDRRRPPPAPSNLKRHEERSDIGPLLARSANARTGSSYSRTTETPPSSNYARSRTASNLYSTPSVDESETSSYRRSDASSTTPASANSYRARRYGRYDVPDDTPSSTDRYGSSSSSSALANKYSNRSRTNLYDDYPSRTGTSAYASRFLNRSKSSAAIDGTEQETEDEHLVSEPARPSSLAHAREEEATERSKRKTWGTRSTSSSKGEEDNGTVRSPVTSPTSEVPGDTAGMEDGSTAGDGRLSSWARYLKNKYGNRYREASRLMKSKSYGTLGDESSDESGDEPITKKFSAPSATPDLLDFNSPRSQYLKKRKVILVFGNRGSGTGCFTWPRGVAISPENNIVVADSSNHRIQVFSENGPFIKEIGQYGTGEGEFDCLAGVAINRIGQYIISDRYNHRIQVLDPNGRFLRAFGSQGSSDGRFNYPWGIATDSLGFVYVCDKENHRIQVFQSDGTFVGKFGSLGKSPGQLDNPHYISVSSTNRIVVSDSNNHRLQVFDINGKVLTSFGSEGSDDGQFKYPRGVAVDEGGYIFVADSGNNRIQIFAPDGQFLRSFGTWGNGEGQFKAMEGIAVGTDGRIVVCDRENHRIQVF